MLRVCVCVYTRCAVYFVCVCVYAMCSVFCVCVCVCVFTRCAVYFCVCAFPRKDCSYSLQVLGGGEEMDGESEKRRRLLVFCEGTVAVCACVCVCVSVTVCVCACGWRWLVLC